MPDSPLAAFDTRAAYQQAIDAVLSAAKKRLCIFDADIRELELEQRARADAIAAFLAGGPDRSLRIVAHDLDHLTRYSPRLMALLKRYSHCFSVRQTPETLRNMADAFMLADEASGVIRFHADHFRGKMLLDRPLEIHDWQQRFEALWAESMPGASATHTGL
ncbi:MAG: hypothetical protein HZC23_00580 [Rhodocyclales bacterium]|nr:hypothetical protein [Rhodocyclales bacterium]